MPAAAADISDRLGRPSIARGQVPAILADNASFVTVTGARKKAARGCILEGLQPPGLLGAGCARPGSAWNSLGRERILIG